MKKLSRFSLGSIGVLSLASAVITSPITAHAQTKTSISKLPIVALKALDSTEHPLSNAQVDVFVLGHITKKTYPIGQTMTDSKGRADIKLGLSNAERTKAKKNGGYLGFSVVVTKKGHTPEVYSFSRDINTSSSKAEFGPKAVTLGPGNSHRAWAKGQTYMTSAHSPMKPIQPNDYCGYVASPDGTTSSYTVIGELHNASDSTSSFTYGQTADSTVEVGYSTSPTSGWSSDGTVKISNTTSSSVGLSRSSSQWYDTGYQLKSDFSYQRTEYSSACGSAYNSTYPPYYITEATQWDGGMEIGNYVGSYDGSPNQYTTWYAPGSTFTRSTNSAYNYGGAVNVFGASLSAQSGFSSDVVEHWHFASGAGYNQALYGNNNYPTQSSIIYAD